MGARGIKPKREDGCYVTKQGYLRRDHTFEHRRVWVETNGPIPAGFVVHHKNENPQDNRLENLALLRRGEHSKLHRELRPITRPERVIPKTKICFRCDTRKPVGRFYAHPRMADGHLNKCKTCTKRDNRGG
jgi:hypothetical protein